MSLGDAVPPAPARRRLGFGTIVWALMPTLSFGVLAPVPFAHAAVRLRDRRLWLVMAAYTIVVLGVFVPLAGTESLGDTGDTLLFLLWLALIITATVHAFLLRGRVFAPASPPSPALPEQPAVVTALAARQRREQARAITTRDPALAHELHIGRPDLPRQFDDGGLVDVNHVPAQVLVDRLGLSPAEAGQVLEARDRLGGFSGPEELVAYTDLSEATVDVLRDQLVFLAAK